MYNNCQSWIMENDAKIVAFKKLYETVLSSGTNQEDKEKAILSILRLALTDHSHFSFLLNQINWFCPSHSALLPLLARILRVYRGMCREAPKVAYNMLAEGLLI